MEHRRPLQPFALDPVEPQPPSVRCLPMIEAPFEEGERARAGGSGFGRPHVASIGAYGVEEGNRETIPSGRW